MSKVSLIRSILVTTLTALFLVGCGGGSDSGSSSFSTFNGTWSNGCEYDQDFGESDLITVTINGSSATVEGLTYENDNCSGTPSSSGSAPFNLSYQGSIALSDCYNGQKINATLEFPVVVNGTTYTETIFNALPDEVKDGIGLSADYDLLCTNQAGTILYGGDDETGDGTSDATRPTSADLTEGLNKQ